MIHYKERYISVKGHVWEITGAVIIYYTGHFVGKCSKAEHVGDGFVLNFIDYVGWQVAGQVIMLFWLYEIWHVGILRPCWFFSSIRGVRVGLGAVLQIPLRGCFRWSFAIAGMAMRYLHTMCAFRWE